MINSSFLLILLSLPIILEINKYMPHSWRICRIGEINFYKHRHTQSLCLIFLLFFVILFFCGVWILEKKKQVQNLFLVEMRSAFKMITTTTLALSVCLIAINEHIFGGVDSAGSTTYRECSRAQVRFAGNCKLWDVKEEIIPIKAVTTYHSEWSVKTSRSTEGKMISMKKRKSFDKVKIICFTMIFFQIPRNIIILFLKHIVKNVSVHLGETDKFQYIDRRE